MYVRQSEFARMCGVTPAAICQLVKNGRLEKSDGKIDASAEKNESYLRWRQNKMAKTSGAGSVSEWNAQSRLGAEVWSQGGVKILSACQTIIRYVEEQEWKLASRRDVVRPPVDAATIQFLQMLTDKIVGTSVDNQYSHDALLSAMNDNYRIYYLRSLAESRKKIEKIT